MEIIIAIFSASILFLYTVFLLVNVTAVNEKNQKIDDLKIVVPFRNEAKRIKKLLNSLEREFSDNKNVEVYFVDDNSYDDTIEIINSEISNALNFQILKNDGKGKKKAIDTAVKLIGKNAWVLTLDADVKLPLGYSDTIFKSKYSNGLNILQIHYAKPKNLLQTLVSTEAAIQNRLFKRNVIFNKPTLCSGAHLLYSTETYHSVNPYKNNFHIPSGDDMFLLDECILKHEAIAYNSISVETEYPENFKQFVKQRKRWLKKSKALKSKHFKTPMYFFVLLLLTILISVFFPQNLVLVFILKMSIESIFLLKMQKINFLSLLFLPLFTIYQLSLPLLYIFGKTTDEANWR